MEEGYGIENQRHKPHGHGVTVPHNMKNKYLHVSGVLTGSFSRASLITFLALISSPNT